MKSILPRRVRVPVLNQLKLAWAILGSASIVLAGYAVWRGNSNNAAKIEVAVTPHIETLAPAKTALRPGSPAELAARPTTKITTASLAPAKNPTSEDVYDDVPTLISASPDNPSQYEFFEDEDDIGSSEVIITIDGAPARKQGERIVLAQLSPTEAIGDVVPRAIESLLKSTIHGKVPTISKSGQRSSKTYAKPFVAPKDKPQIAIVVSGLGLNSALTERAIDELPAAITLSFAPYANDLEFWVEKARRAGHEVVLEIPMEAYAGNPETLGPAALLTSRSKKENLERLDWLLSRFTGYFAVTNYLGGKFSADPIAMKPILNKLEKSGLAYIDDTGAIKRTDAKGNWTFVNRSITAGESGRNASAVKRGLSSLEQAARKDGSALGKTFTYGVAISEIEAWAETLGQRGFVLAPASSVFVKRGKNI